MENERHGYSYRKSKLRSPHILILRTLAQPPNTPLLRPRTRDTRKTPAIRRRRQRPRVLHLLPPRSPPVLILVVIVIITIAPSCAAAATATATAGTLKVAEIAEAVERSVLGELFGERGRECERVGPARGCCGRV